MGQKHRRLAGGVPSTDHNHFLSTTQLRFNKGRAIVNACAFKAREVLNFEFPILGPRRNDNSARQYTSIFVHLNVVGFPVAPKPRAALGNHYLSAELQRLRVCASSEFLARDTGREP